MYVLNQENNKLLNIRSKTFHELGFKEREHLQEWIANNPECLDEELLIIQKEFDGFNDTHERLDLLAVDKSGSLVIIENKLDDTGRDTVWQALKYVSYCSTLSKQQIKEIFQAYLDKHLYGGQAEDNLSEFYDGTPYEEIKLNENDQRIILISGKFRKEVTSTVMWMLNHGIKVQCFKITPYEFKNDVLVDMEQIIPIKEAEDYIIKMADKNREEKEEKEGNRDIINLRKEFWAQFLDEFANVSQQYKNVNPTKDHWLSTGSGVSGVPFTFVVTKNYVSVELSINMGTKDENKLMYDSIYSQKNTIETEYGSDLIWSRMDNKKTCRIADRLSNVDITNREDWPQIKKFLAEKMPKLVKALKNRIKNSAQRIYQLNSKESNSGTETNL